MSKLSVALTTFNEEANIKDCLESVKWADEIVVVDEKSSDETTQIAKKYTSKIFSVDHDPMFHKHKQLALDKCTGDWILQIDADERLSPELSGEIKKIIDSETILNGFKIPRKNIIFNKWIKHTGWYPDYQVKLLRKNKGHFPCKSVHELIEIEGETGILNADLVHKHYNSVTQFIERLNRYTTNDADFLLEKKENIFWTDAIRFPADEFFKRFFLWEGYKDGLHGLVLSGLQAFNRLIVFAKIWETQGFPEYTELDFHSEVIKQSKKVARDWNYWLVFTEINKTKKVILKVKNKVLNIFKL